MRGKLVLFVVLLALAGLTAGWEFARDRRLFIGSGLDSQELATVQRRAGLHLPNEIRVNLTATPATSIRIAIDGPYIVRSFGGGSVLGHGDRLSATVVLPLPRGFRIGNLVYRENSLEIIAEQPPAIWIEDHQFRGAVRIFHQSGGKAIAVNVVGLEDYIASVVDSEMPASFPDAARQAQAIVGRTYALYQLQNARNSAIYDLHATTRSQNYLGYQYRTRDGRRFAGESESGRRAAETTARMVCLCDGQIFCSYYTAVCGGKTAGGEAVFGDTASALQTVPCEWCRDAELYRWTREIPLVEASEAFRRHFVARKKLFDKLASIRRTSGTTTVREPDFEVSDGKRTYRLSVIDVRRVFPPSSIPSFQFDARLSAGQLVLDGRGHGHGVGLCQWGARGMALEGHGPLAILRHYYPGAEIVAAE